MRAGTTAAGAFRIPRRREAAGKYSGKWRTRPEKRQEYERRRAEEERRRRAAGPEPAFQGFTHGGGSRGGGASRGMTRGDKRSRALYQRRDLRRRRSAPGRQSVGAGCLSPDGAGSGGPEQGANGGSVPRERGEEAEQEEKSVSLPPVRQLLAKIAGAAGAGIAGAAGAVNAGIQAAGAAGRIAETFLRPKGVSDWDWRKDDLAFARPSSGRSPRA